MKLTWRKSSRCGNSACVAVGFHKSSFSGGDGCVEMLDSNGLVYVQDSKLGERSPTLSFTHKEWKAFIAGVKAGEFDLP